MDPMPPVPTSPSLRRFLPLRPSAAAGASSRASLPPPVPPSPSTHLTASRTKGAIVPPLPAIRKCRARLLLPRVPLNHHLSSPSLSPPHAIASPSPALAACRPLPQPDLELQGKRWWLGAEDPFQCLAVCINLTEALRSSSLETMISHIPVHQDGTCNGLQHYAALGRDKLGAIAVNLVAREKPADVYSGIATREESLLSIGKIWQCSKIRSRSNYKTL